MHDMFESNYNITSIYNPTGLVIQWNVKRVLVISSNIFPLKEIQYSKFFIIPSYFYFSTNK